MLAGSAHCRSSMTRMAGRIAHCSATSASSCSASTAGTSVPRSAPTSPRSSRTIACRRRVGGRLTHPQPVQERQQRQALAQLVTGPPEHLAAALGRLRHRRPRQRGLADAGLALDEHRPAAPPGHLLLSARSAAPSRYRGRPAHQPRSARAVLPAAGQRGQLPAAVVKGRPGCRPALLLPGPRT